MDNNQFRKATAILFPNVVFMFDESTRTYRALGQHDNVGINLFAKKDSDHINVQQLGEDTAVHDVDTVLGSTSYPPDPFTAEQQKLERMRDMLVAARLGLKTLVNDMNAAAKESAVKAAFIAGQIDQRELFIEALEEVLDAN